MQLATADEKAAGATPKLSFGPNQLPMIPPGSPPFTTVAGLGGQTSLVTNKLSMGKLAELLTTQLQTEVFDKTGLAGYYSFLLHFLPTRLSIPLQRPAFQGSSAAVTLDAAGVVDQMDPELAPTIFSAIQHQLGLRLDQHKAAIDVLVVDKADKTPIEN